ncbi:MAG: prepilin-type N-terminal cleavage/methylation domain-containing protein [Eubacterium sp.]|nr:prepilin-type N-terminal cleavage/methylation domain-containing protein [Eubacterium sp.]
MERHTGAKEGFSLIEVIVAVAILAILSVPILMYFTNSAVHSAQGRYEQAADMAAQSIVEEINSVKSYEHIENDLINMGRGWVVSGVAAGITDKTTISRPISVNNNNYIAEVTIDYGAYGPSPVASGPSALYNAYDNPHFKDLYSEDGVVIAESNNAFNIGVSNLYYEFNGSAPTDSDVPDSGVTFGAITPEMIKQNINRQLIISVTTYSDDVYNVKGSYKFTATIDGNYKETEVVVVSKKIEKTKLKNIYYLFYPDYGGGEITGDTVTQNVFVDMADMMESGGVNRAEDVSISFIRQNTYTIAEGGTMIADPSKEFRLVVAGNNYNTTQTKYYSNDGVILEGVSRSGLMSTSKDKRIALVTIEIYDDDGTGNKTGEVQARGSTTKSV